MVSGLKYRNLIVTELHPVVYDLAPSVGYTIYRRYKNYVEKDDVVQECMAWAISREEWIAELMSVPDIEDIKHNEKRIAWQMRRVAERYARKEKASKSGYQINDEVYYETFTLGQLLPFVIASVIDGTVIEQVQEMIRDGQPRGSSSPAEGGGLLASLIDIKKAFLELEQEDQVLLRMRHHESATLQQVAQYLECATSTADRRCTASLRRLQEILGGENPFR
jgi:DNA-directed RNA polymerase specialized sigma24 family protein